MDSGLETEGSEDQDSAVLEKKDSHTQQPSIKHNSSNLSSQTFDSGLHVRFSGGCLVAKSGDQPQNVPKKRVSIRLPADSRHASLFGPHLQLERTQASCRPSPAGPRSVSEQTRTILLRARAHLLKKTPEICDTVQLLFQPDSILYLKNMNSHQIGNLLHNLRTVLFTGLLDVPYFETSLFMVQNFLVSLSSIVATIPGLEQFPRCFRDLVAKCQRAAYSDQAICLRETQALYIDLWCSLISAL